ncbi:hypothetical protein CY34DRAFT_497282 [Suillus luteus UH-Slu-Lm8-n1]|uniref:Uncharacterized protein n=1 Tax=Suillus luteus UH-Slu-Lm8-n1 TaxID=930992 RepID=A0A0D0AY08_9AGAM|nr:hypothetical protein CY34DRAFT_497282 [Suillus luteus UH-Slu-Lm8-n1]
MPSGGGFCDVDSKGIPLWSVPCLSTIACRIMSRASTLTQRLPRPMSSWYEVFCTTPKTRPLGNIFFNTT